MHKQLGEQIRHRSSIQENLGLLIGVSVTIVAGIIMDGKGMAQKWHAAILGATVPFVFVVLGYPFRVAETMVILDISCDMSVTPFNRNRDFL
jgi:hypothetical protein